MASITTPDGSISIVDCAPLASLAKQGEYILIEPVIKELISQAAVHRAELAAHRVFMISSTASGGGVAEMLHAFIPMLRELGVAAAWAVITPSPALAPAFFATTKSLHNRIHGFPSSAPLDADAFSRVNAACAEDFAARFAPLTSRDFVIVHDPQPCAMALTLRRLAPDVKLVWRSHIGTELASPIAAPAWAFLQPFLADAYDAYVFTHPLYVPPFIAQACARSGGPPCWTILPGISPCTPKNRELAVHEVASILGRAGLLSDVVHDVHVKCASWQAPMAPAALYCGRGVWHADAGGEERQRHGVPFLSRPVVAQISRWDSLKGWTGLLAGFALLKGAGGPPPRACGPAGGEGAPVSDRAAALLCNSVLCLAGPDPRGVSDDPEGAAALAEVTAAFDKLPPHIAADVRIVLFPMGDLEQNALMVNAVQRAAYVIVQNSIREGFGLTVSAWRAHRV